MGLIYATGLKVVIWLGPEADCSDLALEAIGGGLCQRIIQDEVEELSLIKYGPLTGVHDCWRQLLHCLIDRGGAADESFKRF